MMRSRLVAILVIPCGLAAQSAQPALDVLPPRGTTQLAASLAAATAHAHHQWRDTAPFTGDGAVNAYIEISRGDRRKWEFDMRANARAIDRVISEAIGGYPVNYGFVPQTVSYDGDPFDALVLGSAAAGGRVRLRRDRRPAADGRRKGSRLEGGAVTDRPGGSSALRAHGEGFGTRSPSILRKYKREDAGAFSRVDGWGSIADGRAHVVTTHAFFQKCRTRVGAACRLEN